MVTNMAKAAADQLFDSSANTAADLTLEDRETDELVLGFVGPIGSGVSKTCEEVANQLERDYGYESVSIIKVSDLIKQSAHLVGVDPETDGNEAKRVQDLQKVGTELRKKFGENYLAEKCIEWIAIHRQQHGGYSEVEGGQKIAEPKRYAYLIDSLKHPGEIKMLEAVYGGVFWLFGVFAPKSTREARLVGKAATATEITAIFKVDEDEEGAAHGQKVRDTIQLSDFFIRNDRDNTDRLKTTITRYLKLLFGTEIITPTQDETGMYNAAAAAAGSACLSRQVGAAIYSENNELIGKGRNDVPKANGGLYSYEDGDEDHRCHKWKEKRCHNDFHKERLYMSITLELKKAGLIVKDADYDGIRQAIRRTDVKNLIEFSRAVHAEMDAIISVSRGNKPGILGGTMYCTTFPCHSCARHIVASGIVRVVYIEPYPKSLAETLHSDAVTSDDSKDDLVSFVQYQGVAPKNILRLFEYRNSRKKDGEAIVRPSITASPASRSPLDGFQAREQIVVEKLKTLENSHTAASGE